MSSDNRVFVELSGRESKIIDLLREFNEKVGEGETAIAKERKEMVALEREAQRVIKSITTDQEKYNQTLERLNLMRQKDKLTEDQYARAVAKTKAELDKSQLVTAELVRESKDWKAEVGDGLFGNITKAGLALQAIQGVQQAITDLVREELQLRAQGGEQRMGIAGQMASLAQYENFSELRDMSRQLLSTGAFGADASGAIETVKTLQGADLLDQFPQMKNIAASMLFGDQFEQFAQSAGQFRRGFKGQAGDMNQIMSASLGAAYGAPAQAQNILQMASKASGSMAEAGFSANETLALTDIVSRIFGESTPEALQAFGRSVSKDKELAGLSFPEIVYKMQGASSEDIFKRFPDNASKVFLEGRKSLDELEGSEERINAYIGSQYGVAAVQRAFEANAGIRASLISVGEEAATRVFDQGEGQANISRAMKEGRRLISGSMISSAYTHAVHSNPLMGAVHYGAQAAGVGADDAVKILSDINNRMAEQTNIMQKQNKAAPSAVPAVEK